jgi:short-subunit dehydrogenase
MTNWKGQTALITGASFGIGESFAEILAAEGADLVITARARERLESIASRLRGLYSVNVDVIDADLLEDSSPAKIFEMTEGSGKRIDLLVNNAGFGQVGDFDLLPLDRQLDMIQLNVSALVAMSHKFLKPMLERRSGAIIHVASTAAFQGVPYFAVYSATKAFVLTFSEALSIECAERNVKVTCLCPGRTTTNFQSVAGTGAIDNRNAQTPEQVVRKGLEALEKGKSYVVSGSQNRTVVLAERLVSRSLATRAAARLYGRFKISRDHN